MKKNKVTDALLGVAVGDAVGVPYEFLSNAEMRQNPATDMIGFGTHQQPKGTWSDDSSLTFCLAESLCQGYDLVDMARRFIAWEKEAYWTAHNEVFDMGMTTSRAISRLEKILQEEAFEELKRQRFYGNERDNGNGSLMRILPLLFYIKNKPIKEQFEIIWTVSALTHRHIRAAMCCLIYLKLAEYILKGINKQIAYEKMRQEILAFWQEMDFAASEQAHFQRFIQNDVRKVPYQALRSGGYVMESIEASIWCFLQGENYREVVLKSVNLGHDTDTTAAIAGGLAGLNYGVEGIPEHWLVAIAKMEEIWDLGARLNAKVCITNCTKVQIRQPRQ